MGSIDIIFCLEVEWAVRIGLYWILCASLVETHITDRFCEDPILGSGGVQAQSYI